MSGEWKIVYRLLKRKGKLKVSRFIDMNYFSVSDKDAMMASIFWL